LELKLVRILIVDDYQPWRSMIQSIFREDPEFEIVGESLDGLEAIQMSKQLQPDVVLLDIGLPKRNGFEAAREIRRVSPHSKIIFLSQNRSEILVREARRIGAQGFVSKTDAGCDLLPAIRAALGAT
jgi:two-component system, NarL family, nitrate/nitrite response regulator NarL